jgi:DNA-binding response OmpR family regulator
MIRPLIFIVDGEVARNNFARRTLEGAGYAVNDFFTADVLESAQRELPALMLVALRLPNGNGIELCRRIRGSPVLRRTRTILVADSREEQDLVFSEAPADDCICTPYHPLDLLDRVETALHYSAHPVEPASSPKDAEIVIDSSAMKLRVRGSEISTTGLEFRLIDFMARHRGKVFTRDALLDAVWGDMQFVTPRSVDACVGRLRRKIEHDRSSPRYLRTIRGIGYKLDAIAAWEASLSCQCLRCSMSRARSKTAS